MASISEQREFDSWHRAFLEKKLTPKQLEILQQVVDDKQAETLERAAFLLDWQETVIDPDEHMYGF